MMDWILFILIYFNSTRDITSIGLIFDYVFKPTYVTALM